MVVSLINVIVCALGCRAFAIVGDSVPCIFLSPFFDISMLTISSNLLLYCKLLSIISQVA